jgi:hypothetical protein
MPEVTDEDLVEFMYFMVQGFASPHFCSGPPGPTATGNREG